MTIAQQATPLRMAFPQGAVTANPQRLRWEGLLTPSVCSRTYDIRVCYQLGRVPKAWVLEPDLHIIAGDRKIPHLYDQDKIELCLYLPKERKREWHPGRSIATTFMLWIPDWLLHFEAWIYTGEWEGGGVHPN